MGKKADKYKKSWEKMSMFEQDKFLRDSADKYGIDFGDYSRFGDEYGARGTPKGS